MNKKILAAAICATLGSASVLAWESGDIVVRAGVTAVSPSNGDNNVLIPNGGADTGFSLKVQDDTQLGLNLAWFYKDNVALELLAATPFTHEIDLADAGALNGVIAEITHLPPTLSALYYFNDASSAFQPYAGLGVNYTFTYSEDFTSAYKAAGFSNLSVENSLGLAAQVGFDYMLDENWLVNASVRYIDIEAEATFDQTLVAGGTGSSTVEINPWVYSLLLGYKF